MAAAFAKLPMRVLWRLSKSELPDDNAITDLHLSDNTKASVLTLRIFIWLSAPLVCIMHAACSLPSISFILCCYKAHDLHKETNCTPNSASQGWQGY
jgi:hypothetical protein